MDLAKINTVDVISCTNLKFNIRNWLSLPDLGWVIHIFGPFDQHLWKDKKHKDDLRDDALTKESTNRKYLIF